MEGAEKGPGPECECSLTEVWVVPSEAEGQHLEPEGGAAQCCPSPLAFFSQSTCPSSLSSWSQCPEAYPLPEAASPPSRHVESECKEETTPEACGYAVGYVAMPSRTPTLAGRCHFSLSSSPPFPCPRQRAFNYFGLMAWPGMVIAIELMAMAVIALGFDAWTLMLPWMTRLVPSSQHKVTYYLLRTHIQSLGDAPCNEPYCHGLGRPQHAAASLTFVSLALILAFSGVCMARYKGSLRWPRPFPQLIAVLLLMSKALALLLWMACLPPNDIMCGGDESCRQESGYTICWASCIVATVMAVLSMCMPDAPRCPSGAATTHRELSTVMLAPPLF